MSRIDSKLVSIYNAISIYLKPNQNYIFAVDGKNSNSENETFKVEVSSRVELDDLITQAENFTIIDPNS